MKWTRDLWVRKLSFAEPHNASLRHQSFRCTAGLLSKGKASSFEFRP